MSLLEDAQVFVDAWKPRFGLTDAQITLLIVPRDKIDGANATTSTSADRSGGTIRLAENYADYDPPRSVAPTNLEQTIVHELLHISLTQYRNLTVANLKWLGGDNSVLINGILPDLESMEETVVDRLAFNLVRAWQAR